LRSTRCSAAGARDATPGSCPSGSATSGSSRSASSSTRASTRSSPARRARLYPEVEIAGLALRRSALREHPRLARLASTAAELEELADWLRAATSAAPRLLLVDDGEAVPDDGRLLTDLFAAPATPGWHAIVAGRADGLRGLGHWSTGVRRSRTGLLLIPDVQTDGGLLGVTLPRRPLPPARPGCGYLVQSGALEVVQAARAALSPAG
jgi:S-DNA-T family DNA segregation ATPase FtsK/SpoIIIE